MNIILAGLLAISSLPISYDQINQLPSGMVKIGEQGHTTLCRVYDHPTGIVCYLTCHISNSDSKYLQCFQLIPIRP